MSTNFNNVNAHAVAQAVNAYAPEQGSPVNQGRFEDPACTPLEDLK